MGFLKNNKLIVALLLLNFIGIIGAFLFSYTVVADNVEHIRASYLVSLGEVPYRDFFEHHHPFLWYLFAPVIAVLPHHAVITFYAAKFLALIFSGLAFWVLYRIATNFLGAKKLFLYFAVIVGSFFPIWYGVSLFKPDTVARFFYFWAIFWLFDYIKNRQRHALIYFGLSLTSAVLFLQTIVFEAIPLVLVAVVLFWKDKKFIKDGMLTALLVVAVIGVLVDLLCLNGMMTTYFQLNWLYNMNLFQNIHGHSSSVIGDWAIVITAALIAFGVMLKNKTNVYWKIIGFLFCCEILQHCIFPAIYSHYLINLLVFAAFLLAQAFILITDKTVRGYIWTFLVFSILINFFTLYQYNSLFFMKFYAQLNSSADKQVLHSPMNIYAPKVSYYDLFSRDFALLDDCLFHRYPDYDINKMIENYRFEYVWYEQLDQTLLQRCPAERFTLHENAQQLYKKVFPKVYKHI